LRAKARTNLVEGLGAPFDFAQAHCASAALL
jgi:hypothetical protein